MTGSIIESPAVEPIEKKSNTVDEDLKIASGDNISLRSIEAGKIVDESTADIINAETEYSDAYFKKLLFRIDLFLLPTMWASYLPKGCLAGNSLQIYSFAMELNKQTRRHFQHRVSSESSKIPRWSDSNSPVRVSNWHIRLVNLLNTYRAYYDFLHFIPCLRRSSKLYKPKSQNWTFSCSSDVCLG